MQKCWIFCSCERSFVKRLWQTLSSARLQSTHTHIHSHSLAPSPHFYHCTASTEYGANTMANNNMYAILYARAIEYFTNHYVLILWTQTLLFLPLVCLRSALAVVAWVPIIWTRIIKANKFSWRRSRRTVRSMKKVSTLRVEWNGLDGTQVACHRKQKWCILSMGIFILLLTFHERIWK